MGLYTPNSQVWYPTTSDTAEINTLMSTMASSIEEGIGNRLKNQEKLVSAVLNIPNNGVYPALPPTTAVIPNFQVTTFGYNIGGMPLNAGVLTIQEAGIYFISSTVTFNDNGQWYAHGIDISGVEKVRGMSFKPNGGSVFQYSSQTTVVKLAAGDTVRTRVVSENGPAGNIRDLSVAGNVMTCTLLKPL